MNKNEFKQYVKELFQKYQTNKISREEMAKKIMDIPRESLVEEDAKYLYDNTDIGKVFDIAWQYDLPSGHREKTWGKDWEELEQIVSNWQ